MTSSRGFNLQRQEEWRVKEAGGGGLTLSCSQPKAHKLEDGDHSPPWVRALPPPPEGHPSCLSKQARLTAVAGESNGPCMTRDSLPSRASRLGCAW